MFPPWGISPPKRPWRGLDKRRGGSGVGGKRGPGHKSGEPPSWTKPQAIRDALLAQPGDGGGRRGTLPHLLGAEFIHGPNPSTQFRLQERNTPFQDIYYAIDFVSDLWKSTDVRYLIKKMPLRKAHNDRFFLRAEPEKSVPSQSVC